MSVSNPYPYQNLPPNPHRLTRRSAITVFAAALSPGWLAAADAASLLRTGGCAMMIRHAQTVSGVGDPPNFDLAVCSTQRNLSEAGRAQAQALGVWFKAKGLQPRAVLTSAWCRCIDTANLAFGHHALWQPLNSTFGNSALQPEQTAKLRQALGQIPKGQFEVWVTHQVNMTAFTGEYPSMGEGFVVDPHGKLLARSLFA